MLPNGVVFLSHHIDHIRPKKHDGKSTADHLCLSCYLCNSYKGTDVSAYDPLTDELLKVLLGAFELDEAGLLISEEVDDRTWEQVKADIERDRWTPPDAKSALELLREVARQTIKWSG